jgi:hypothetical protein
VAFHTITTRVLDLVPNYVVLVLGNEGGGPHHMQGCYTWGPMDWFKEGSGFDFEYSSNIQLRLKIILDTYF